MKLCAAFVFVVCCTGFCGAIRCYSCDSNINGNCADKFDPSGITVANNCNQCGKVKCNQCSKSQGEAIVAQYVFKTCETVTSAIGCSEITNFNLVKVQLCYCNTDLCNSGPRVAERFAIGVVLLVLFLRSL